MKKLLVILVASGLFAMPAFAAEHEGMKMRSQEGMTMNTDDGLRQCALQAETIQQKIKRLNAEAASGSKQYNTQELKKLENKLKEANETLDNLTKP